MNKWIALVMVCIAAPAVAADAVPFKHNSKTPIDITADALEVLQQDGKAIFTGHVVAVQGDVRLTAEKMTVFYRQSEKGAKEKKNDSGAIRKIEVEQNVFLTTPGETASGVSGVYDVENRQIQLNNNVVLTKDKNTLKGDKLVYDFSTGKSVLTSGSQPAVGNVPGEKGKQRVRALFVPEDSGQKQP